MILFQTYKDFKPKLATVKFRPDLSFSRIAGKQVCIVAKQKAGASIIELVQMLMVYRPAELHAWIGDTGRWFHLFDEVYGKWIVDCPPPENLWNEVLQEKLHHA